MSFRRDSAGPTPVSMSVCVSNKERKRERQRQRKHVCVCVTPTGQTVQDLKSDDEDIRECMCVFGFVGVCQQLVKAGL